MSALSFATASHNGTNLDAPPTAAGVYDIALALPDQSTARFTLSLPPAFDSRPAEPRPLVLVLHYGGQPTPFYGRPLIEQLFAPAWQELDAIYVAPQSIDGAWNTAANEAFVMQLLELIEATYAVDAARVVVAGYSMGAIGSWHFIQAYPERFSAAVPVAGISRGELSCPVPVYALATPTDEVFDYAAISSAIETLRDSGCRVELTEVDARGHYDLNGFKPALSAVHPWLDSVWSAAND